MRYRGMTLRDWYYELRYQVRRIYSFFIRGYYGVAPMDAWSLDRHVLAVLARGMRELAKKPYGVPMFIADEYMLEKDEHGGPVDVDKAVECWQHWLTRYAKWLEWYVADEINFTEGMSDAQKTAALDAYTKKYETFKSVVLPHIMAHVDDLWS